MTITSNAPDGDQFLNEQNDVASEAAKAKVEVDELFRESGVVNCVDCQERISQQRKALMPGVTRCYDCQLRIEEQAEQAKQTGPKSSHSAALLKSQWR